MDVEQAADGTPQVHPEAPAARRGRVIAAAAIVLVVAGIGIALAVTADEGDGPGTTVACTPAAGSGAATSAPGLEIEDTPDALPPAVLCAFPDDTPVDIASVLGEAPVVLNFWATWCVPCVEEMPDFQRLHDVADGRIRLVGINTQDAPPLARDFAEDLGITYELLRDPRGQYFEATRGFGMPTTLFVTPEGEIRFRHTGPLTLAQMADLVGEHLGVDLRVGS